MAKITVEANQCDVCGYVWLPTGKTAVQCAKCRTRKWDKGLAVEIIHIPRSQWPQSVRDVFARANSSLPAGNSPKVEDFRFAPERTVEYEE